MKHLTASDLDELRRAPAADDRLRHLAECADCAARAEAAFGGGAVAVRAFTAAFSETPADEPHPEEELPLYVDGKLADARRKQIDEHLANCASCREEVSDLRAFSSTLQPPAVARPRRRQWTFLAVAASLLVLLFVLRDDAPVTTDPANPASTAAVTTTVATTSTVTPPVPPKPTRKPEWEALVVEAVHSGSLQIAADVLHFASPDAYRGTTEGSTQTRLSPAGTAVEDTRPIFTWPATPRAVYEVIVAIGDVEAARSGPLDVARWRPEEPLQRGTTYRWQVIVNDEIVLPQRPAPPAIFRVLDTKQHDELESARRAHPGDDLLLGVLYAKAGEVRAAREHLERAGADRLVRDLDQRLGLSS
ncbi:MAG TPA: zf-HC2 domain-containing protein [Thermoanaerobaculia bacterium]|nr:zf-HC2 domain-containing protein [Thermoanaerobaculia bacterium]